MGCIIKTVNLTKVYKNQTVVNNALSDINLEIEEGEIFGIIGLSGAGKSTLVKTLNYLEKPTEGQVYFYDQNLGILDAKGLRDIRKQMTMIFQNFNLFEQQTVLKNVMFPLEISGIKKKEAMEIAREKLKLVDLIEKEKDYPSKLSGGQKQRVAIARALATNPKVLLCDEATSALDPKTTMQILDLLKKINNELKVTIVIITHQMNVIETTCHRVAIIDGGKIAEIGNVSEVFRAPKSDMGKKLILGMSDTESDNLNSFDNKLKCVRLAFDGDNSNVPIISNMILETGVEVNILFANIKEIEGKSYGQMVLGLPMDRQAQDKVIEHLNKKKVTFSEVN